MVSLKSESNNPVDSYINANYVTCPFSAEKNVFIATQGPIPSSMNNFWTMVWNEMITVVVMLCGLEEHGRVRFTSFRYLVTCIGLIMNCPLLHSYLESSSLYLERFISPINSSGSEKYRWWYENVTSSI